MKTTLELPDELLRRTKAVAALRGMSMRDFVAQALEAQLKTTTKNAGWRKVFGRGKGLDTASVQRLIDAEFSRVDKSKW
jgi:hypothetical protein